MNTAGTTYTHTNLKEVEDAAPGMGLSEDQELRFANGDLDALKTGVTYLRFAARYRQGFGHRHENAEEVYVVLSGSGRMKLDDEVRELGPLDAVRVAPPVIRSFEAGPEGLEILACGAQHEGDGELLHGWWTD